MNLFIYIGNDDGAVKAAASAQFKALTQGVDDGFTHEVIDGGAENSEAAYQICKATVQALQTMPMFGGNKVVWLKHVNFLMDDVTGRSQRTDEGVTMLHQACEKGLSADVALIISAQGMDKRKSFWKWLSQHAQVEVMNMINTSKEGWEEQVAILVEQEAHRMNLEFEPEALMLFVQLTGAATEQIHNELQKLALYIGNSPRAITLEDIRNMVPLSHEAVIFEIGQALLSGRLSRTIELINQRLMDDDKDAISIMRASLIPTIRNIFIAKIIQEELKISARSYNDLENQLSRLPAEDKRWLPQKKDGSGLNLYPVFLCFSSAKKFSLSGLQQAMKSCMQADEALVSTSIDKKLLLQRVVAEITQARNSK